MAAESFSAAAIKVISNTSLKWFLWSSVRRGKLPLFLQVPLEKTIEISSYKNENKKWSSSMKVRTAHHILKLLSLGKSNNNCNNNDRITLTFRPMHSEVPMWINMQPPIYTCVVFQKFFYKLAIWNSVNHFQTMVQLPG